MYCQRLHIQIVSQFGSADGQYIDDVTRSLGTPQRLVWRKRVLVDSIRKLLNYRFEWVLAGHGDRTRLPAGEMRAQVQALLERNQTTSVVP